MKNNPIKTKIIKVEEMQPVKVNKTVIDWMSIKNGSFVSFTHKNKKIVARISVEKTKPLTIHLYTNSPIGSQNSTKYNLYYFEDYIFHPGGIPVSFNKHNFKKLKEYKLLKYYYDFGGTFRGNIVDVHKIGAYEIIEASKKEETSFYNVGDFSTSYSGLEDALLNQIFKGMFSDTLTSLLKIAHEKEL